jgi:histidyl-tRNA synthetase
VAEPIVDYSRPKGTRDILPPESQRWRRLVGVFAEVVEAAGYGYVVPPMFEHVEVFHRLGVATDIVAKEMYEFTDRGGRRLALRPEQTASVVRMFVENRPTVPWKVWYAGSNFRAENVQKGRYRQFDQVGVEVLGVDDPYLDVEVIALAWRFYQRLGLSQVRLVLNSLGAAGDRGRYSEALLDYFRRHHDALSPESRDTLTRNPLRVLDSKRASDREIVANAPRLRDHLSADAAAQFETVQQGLRDLDIPFTVDDRLVRGLDYYCKTTFEFAADALHAAQNAVGGGGRYDGLVEEMGGPPTAGIGFALGVDRTLLACDAEGAFAAPAADVDVFVVDTTGGSHASSLTDELWRAGIRAERAYENRSMKAQMKVADRSGAAIALIVGADEAAAGIVTVRPLRRHDGEGGAAGTGAKGSGAKGTGAKGSGAQAIGADELGAERTGTQRQIARADVVDEIKRTL